MLIRKILRYFYRNILPLGMKRSIDIFEHLRMESFEGLKERNILVLSPHPDDDIIGCGGTLHIYHQKGAEITAVYMTDGRKGNPEYNEDDLVSTRKEEAKKVAEIVGINKLIFLDNRDSELSNTYKTTKELSEIIMNIKPEAVFLPFLLDNHSDHIAANDIFVHATKDYTGVLSCYGYEVWTPLPAPNCIIDITAQIEVKRKAIEQHYSQLTQVNFIDAFIGLSKYRSVLYNFRDGYAEAFIHCDITEYRRLWQVSQ